MDRCPNCRARWDGGETCRRCGMDLAPLLVVEQATEGLLARAVAQLARGDSPGAIRTLAKAQGLSAEPLVRHLEGFARRLADWHSQSR
jgi:hypothetical protein